MTACCRILKYFINNFLTELLFCRNVSLFYEFSKKKSIDFSDMFISFISGNSRNSLKKIFSALWKTLFVFLDQFSELFGYLSSLS